MMKIRLAAMAVMALAWAVAPAAAQTLEKKSLTVGVGGKPLLYYLPLTIAERLGYFKEQGLEIEIADFGGGAKSLQALIGGSVDVVTGAYEHTIRMQEKGQDIRAVIDLGRYPAIVLAVRKEKAAAVKSAADLKGLNIGVTAPGSSTQMLAQYAMVKAGLRPDDASFIGIGAGASAVAAIQKGQIDAISHLDPVVTKLQQSGDIKILIDTRTTDGTRELFGGTNPAAVLYMKKDFIDRNPNTVRALVKAFKKSLDWIAKATPEQIADTVPEDYWLGDKALYIAAVQATKDAYSPDGRIEPADMASALNLLTTTEPSFKASSVDLSKTVDMRFLEAK